jgi:hypothetical protein
MDDKLKRKEKLCARLIKANDDMIHLMTKVIEDFLEEPWPECFSGGEDLTNDWPEALNAFQSDARHLMELFDAVVCETSGSALFGIERAYSRSRGDASADVSEARRLVAIFENGSKSDAEAAKMAFQRLPYDVKLFVSCLDSMKGRDVADKIFGPKIDASETDERAGQ